MSNVHVHWLWCVIACLAPPLMAGTDTTSGAVAARSSFASPAQQPTFRSSKVGFSARVAHSDQLETARSYRLYDEPLQIVLILTIFYDSLEPATADQRAFARQMRVAIRTEGGAPQPVTTDGTFWRYGDGGRLALDAGEPLRVVSGRGIEWELRLRRADGLRFTTGRHTIDLSLSGSFTTLRLADSSLPGARLSETLLTIQLGPPANADELGKMHALAALEAMLERRFEDAAAAAQKAIDANPPNAGAYTVLGGAFLQLNKCHEAAVALEKVLQRALIGHTSIPNLLAQAYVCSGDENNARRVLRLRGIPEARLDAEIAHLRELVSRRRTQKPR